MPPINTTTTVLGVSWTVFCYTGGDDPTTTYATLCNGPNFIVVPVSSLGT